ncbi:MAG: NAD(P)H-dependent glycerol-3-phosphate dehydrogenase [Bacteroidota bacterium]|nr:NAD(P)H-dependent glycerol-3-phosphate dehydrogenase [Bacteroidota bacterium]MDP4233262.1 NAD(P)H-dependent glycerol-3-phosphate dehydrogenase [Bacteroidota bacterium]MDP4242118.1 NAD(P)H-dependent glycerol-3-phosphate dehydrogenase [Bacteroidota bacterium]MDP4289083.1 NAD(P)H-dependent glycerol-3-phosphate dehydrogenase [Bacteroidota bacterium]
MNTAVIGAGAWGTALARVLMERGHSVTLWAHREEFATELRESRENAIYLPGIQIDPEIEITHSPEAIAGKELYVFALPSQATRAVTIGLRQHIARDACYVNASKGIERGSDERVTEIIAESLAVSAARTVVLSGPSHAEEVARRVPTAVVIAGENHDTVRTVQDAFFLPYFRVYSSSDVIGVELAGALKNVIAICAGMIDGAGFGDNTKAALMTRGLAEMRRLGVALGAEEHTFSGLAGLGDLVVTCASRHSRNRYVGEQIGLGRTLADIQASMKKIAEGITTTESARSLARSHKIEMPIIEETYRILFEGKDPREATNDLMTRNPKSERW